MTDRRIRPAKREKPSNLCVVCKAIVPQWAMPKDPPPVCDKCQRAASLGRTP